MRRPSAPPPVLSRAALAALALAAAAPAAAAVTATPPSVTVTPGQKAEVSITWSFEREPIDRLVSERGEFISLFDLAPLQVVAVKLEGTLTRGAGTVVEKLTVPPSLVEAMRARGVTQVRYVRLFDRSEGTVLVELGAAGAGKPTIETIELAFAGGVEEATVARRGRVPAVVARLGTRGAGPLEATWELDGKPHARVTLQLDALGSLRIELPELPPLPAETPGVHTLRLVPARSVRGFGAPSLRYTVTPEAAAEAPPTAPLALTGPADGAAVPFEAVRLAWAPGASAIYLVDLRDCASGAAHFSTYARAPPYRLPAFGVAKSLVPGSTVCWRVVGFDEAGLAVEASEVRRFRILHAAGAP